MRRFILVSLAVGVLACDRAPAFDAPRAISTATSVGVAPMFAVSPSGDEAVAWVSAPSGGTDGRLYISVNGAQPAEIRDTLGPVEAHGESPPKIAYGADGTLHAIYVVAKVVPGNRFPLAALRHVHSRDGGKTWSAPTRVTDDADFGSHNFHALHVTGDGRVYASWLDGRLGKSGAFMAMSSDGGETWGPNTRVSVDEACPCCRTAIATDSGGVVYMAWRTVLPGNVRDIVVARSDDAGKTWQQPSRVHADEWVFDGCPHAGPSLAVDRAHRLHIAWWTGKDGHAGVFYANSADGKTFSEPVTLKSADHSRPSHAQLALDGDHVAVAWDDGITKIPSVQFRESDDGGKTFGAATTVSAENRVASFPVLAFSPKGITVAWTEEDPDAHAHAEASHPDMKDPKSVMPLTPVGNGKVMARTLSR